MTEPHKDVGDKESVDKPQYDLIPPYPLSLVAYTYTVGTKKYAARNWEKGVPPTEYLSALMRHLEKYRLGERIDPSDGKHHLAAVVFYCFGLMQFEVTHPELFEDTPCTKP